MKTVPNEQIPNRFQTYPKIRANKFFLFPVHEITSWKLGDNKIRGYSVSSHTVYQFRQLLGSGLTPVGKKYPGQEKNILRSIIYLFII